MSIMRAIAPEVAVDLPVARTVEELQTLRGEDCPGVLWHRPLDARLLSWVGDLDPELLPETRQILHREDVSQAVLTVCDLIGTPGGDELLLLVEDIAVLAEGFNRVVPAPYLRLRLSVVTNNACRRFHTDNVVARLICTYRGTGTQYGVPVNGAEPDEIHTVPCGVPVILRGGLWPTDPPSRLKHRSPPIEGTNETRLILVLDPVYDPDEED